MSPELRLTLLGGFTVTLDNQPVAGLTSHKAQALLCYLAVTGRTFSRPFLAGLLWPDIPEANARMNLRKELARLNQVLRPYLRIERESVALDPTANWRLDVKEFERLLDALPHRQPAIEDLTAAVALYPGDFLEGFYVLNSPTLEEWLLRQRGRLRERALYALQTLSNAYTQQACDGQAITTLQQLLTLEPWREEAHRQLMTHLARSGQRAAALAQYEICRQVLADELAVEPDTETLALVAAIRTGEFDKVTSDKVTSTGSVTLSLVTLSPPMQFTTKADYPLVGRAAEWATLHTCWQTLARPHFVCIGGEAGIGKTRLAEELLLLAEREGTPVARTRSHALQGQLAYSPITDTPRAAPSNGGSCIVWSPMHSKPFTREIWIWSAVSLLCTMNWQDCWKRQSTFISVPRRGHGASTAIAKPKRSTHVPLRPRNVSVLHWMRRSFYRSMPAVPWSAAP